MVPYGTRIATVRRNKLGAWKKVGRCSCAVHKGELRRSVPERYADPPCVAAVMLPADWRRQEW
jgi:hypothetical protein